MPNHRDFLLALDDHLDGDNLGYVMQGSQLFRIAEAAHLCAPGDTAPALWTGELVTLGYVVWRLRNAGDPQPVPTWAWTRADVQRFSDYYVTAHGREEADRLRRQRRESLTDAAMGAVLPRLVRPWMTGSQQQAISGPLADLRAALDSDRRSAVIGAAKDLTEAACKVSIERSGRPVPASASLPALFKLAAEMSAAASEESAVGHRLAAVVDQLARLRNVAGAGHGRAAQPDISDRGARLAATAACGVAAFLLSEAPSPGD